MTQQNAALVEEAAAAAASLHDQTVNLAQAVAVFQIEGVTPAATAATAPAERRAQGSGMRTPKPVPKLEHQPARRKAA